MRAYHLGHRHRQSDPRNEERTCADGGSKFSTFLVALVLITAALPFVVAQPGQTDQSSCKGDEFWRVLFIPISLS
ncbi:hypothetical protein PILCRDRAFT_353603 [Piloderma croceum F 1598]|uniref:Uncharacterized protein n=1 Tax=Piloderma croceum (strain F 1598) TaxID=765440 RepID=A0A0C3G3Q3_PILCF|nr:hypothetical protein PILCRDRAFT_353603 [Piloderma croceum F 1598]